MTLSDAAILPRTGGYRKLRERPSEASLRRQEVLGCMGSECNAARPSKRNPGTSLQSRPMETELWTPTRTEHPMIGACRFRIRRVTARRPSRTVRNCWKERSRNGPPREAWTHMRDLVSGAAPPRRSLRTACLGAFSPDYYSHADQGLPGRAQRESAAIEAESERPGDSGEDPSRPTGAS